MIICNIDSRIQKQSRTQIPQRILRLREASRKAKSHQEKLNFLLPTNTNDNGDLNREKPA
ncbi:MAG TPA: hypothetical protein DEP88_04470 [Verrucomicrobiales bacterium]|jgi:hypothetical protein|nr:hypothetical protein [Verrucomicrobiales bacterium]HCL98072.1 hypothetical protein [Verrucomicrobiales bacterium]